VPTGRPRSTDQLASARIAVATMASASAGVNPPCPVALRYIAAPKIRSNAISGVDLRIQFTAGDSAIPDLPHGCAADVHLVCSYPLAFNWVKLRLPDELRVDRPKRAGVEAHNAAQCQAEVFGRRPGVWHGRVDHYLVKEGVDGHRGSVRPPFVDGRLADPAALGDSVD
jgi:hypothetical protein